MSTNLARFLIGSSPSADRGFDAAATSVTLQLEASSGLIRSTTFAVYDAADPASPLASASAPTLTLNNGIGSTGRKVNAATPTSSVTLSGLVLASGHAHLVRCLVNDGLDAAGRPSAQHVFERLIACRSNGRRRLVPGESTQGSARGWADEIWMPDPAVDLVVPVVATHQTTNATPLVVTVPLPVSDGKTAYWGIRVRGRSAAGDVITRDMQVVYDRVGGGTIMPKVLPADPDAPWTDTGRRVVNRSIDLLAAPAADIAFGGYSGGVQLTLTGKAGLTLNWTIKVWRDEF